MSGFGDGFAINMFNFEPPLVFIFLLPGQLYILHQINTVPLELSESHLEILVHILQ